MKHTAEDLVDNILCHSADRIRYNTFSSSGELRIAQEAAVHLGQYEGKLTVTSETAVLDDYHATVEVHDYHSTIRASPRNTLVLQYRGLPNQDEPRIQQLPPGFPAPLYTRGQLERAVANNDVDELRQGLTRAFLTETSMSEDSLNVLGTEIGFSNAAAYRAMQITQPRPPDETYEERDNLANNPSETAYRIDLPNPQ